MLKIYVDTLLKSFWVDFCKKSQNSSRHSFSHLYLVIIYGTIYLNFIYLFVDC